MQGKRNYKDSLFRNIFKDKKRLCSLYNALSGENISPKDITINTLRGTFYHEKNAAKHLRRNSMCCIMVVINSDY